jgi:hypothetical protein
MLSEVMKSVEPSLTDCWMAAVCVHCPVCRHARRRQAGAAFRFTRSVETRFCPFCQAYARVYGRPAHAPLTGSGEAARNQ